MHKETAFHESHALKHWSVELGHENYDYFILYSWKALSVVAFLCKNDNYDVLSSIIDKCQALNIFYPFHVCSL